MPPIVDFFAALQSLKSKGPTTSVTVLLKKEMFERNTRNERACMKRVEMYLEFKGST